MTKLSSLLQVSAAAGLFALVALVSGCAKHQTVAYANVPIQPMTTNGFMSQADYDKIRQIEANTSHYRTISDSDLAWTINFIKSSTNPIERARGFTALARISPMTSAQKAQIQPVVTPYLNSTNKLDYASAQMVEKTLQS